MVCSGSVRDRFGVRAGFVRGAFRDPFGIRSGSVRGPFGIRSGPETKNANLLLEPIFREKPFFIFVLRLFDSIGSIMDSTFISIRTDIASESI